MKRVLRWCDLTPRERTIVRAHIRDGDVVKVMLGSKRHYVIKAKGWEQKRAHAAAEFKRREEISLRIYGYRKLIELPAEVFG